MRSPNVSGGLPRTEPDRVSDAWLEAELVRARRSGGSVAVIVIVADVDGPVARSRRRWARHRPVRVLEDTVRRYDLVIEADEPGAVLVVAPDTTAESAQALTERLSSVTGRRAGCACFPQDGRSRQALLAHADQMARRQLLPAPLPAD